MIVIPHRRKAFQPTGGGSTLLDDLVVFLPCTEESGTRADAHSNGLDATDNNTVGFGTIDGSNAASFNAASSEYLSIPDDALLYFTTGLTFSAWIHPDDWPDFRCFATKGSFGSAPFVFYTVASGQNRLRTGWNGTAYYDTPDSFSWTGSAKHLVITYDGTESNAADRIKLYKDGAAVTMTSISGTAPISLNTNSSDLYIGGPNGTLSYFDGLMADVGLWSRALSSDEVAELYNGGTRLTYADL